MSGAAPLSYSTLRHQHEPRGGAVGAARWFGKLVFWAFVGGVMVAGSGFAVAGIVNNGLLGSLTPIAAILLLIAGATLAGGVRRVRDLAVLSYLEHAIRTNAPLLEMLAAAEQSERGAVQLRLRRLRQRLEAGDAISEALSIAAPALSRRMIGVIAAGECIGQTPAAVRRVTTLRGFLPPSDSTNSIFYRWYPLMVITGCFAGLQLILIFVAPKMAQIGRDYRLPPPAALRFLQVDAQACGFLILIILVLSILLVCGRMASQLFTARGMTLGPLRSAADVLLWYTPFARVAVRGRAMADVCYILAHALKAGIAPNRAIAEAANAAGNFVLERRMRKWAANILSGGDLASAARRARMPALVVGLLSTARGQHDAAEIFDFLSRHYDAQFSRAAIFLRGATPVLIAVGGGLIVLAVASGIFQPLVAIMNRVATR